MDVENSCEPNDVGCGALRLIERAVFAIWQSLARNNTAIYEPSCSQQFQPRKQKVDVDDCIVSAILSISGWQRYAVLQYGTVCIQVSVWRHRCHSKATNAPAHLSLSTFRCAFRRPVACGSGCGLARSISSRPRERAHSLLLASSNFLCSSAACCGFTQR